MTALTIHGISYKYDVLNRLTEVTLDNGQKITYTYDAAGNMTGTTVGSPQGLNLSPVLTPIGNKLVAEGQTLQFTLLATDSNNDTLTYSAAGLPPGATLGPATGAFSWTPDYTSAGSYEVQFRVSDGNLTASDDVTIAVTEANPSIGVSIGDAGASEGNTGLCMMAFAVTISAPSPWDVTADYVTADATAQAGRDYVAQAGRLVFPAGVTTQWIKIAVNGDTLSEPDRTFLARLTAATNAAITRAEGRGTIRDDDRDAQSVQPVDATTGATPVTLSFSRITQPGATTLVTGSSGPAPPAGYRLGNPPIYYEIETAAAYDGPIAVSINYGGVTYANESGLRLFHYEGQAWVDRTVALDTVNDMITAQVSTLSPFAVFEPVGVTAASTSVTWARTYGGSGDEKIGTIRRTSDGGSVIAGETASFGAGGTDCWVVKLDCLGNIAWQKTFGGLNSDSFNDIRETPGGGYIAVGATHSAGAGGSDVLIAKLNSSGGIVWQKTYGGFYDEAATAVIAANDGGYLLAGTTTVPGNKDLLLLKLNADGGLAWSKTYGSSLDDGINAVEPLADGGYLAAGSTASFGAGGEDAWLLRLDAAGEILWQKTYGGSGDDSFQDVRAVAGGYVAAGVLTASGASAPEAWALWLNDNGEIANQKIYHAPEAGAAEAVQKTADGGFIIAVRAFDPYGLGQSEGRLLRLEPGGGIIWQKSYGFFAGQSGLALETCDDGGCVLAGTASNGGRTDLEALKIDGTGGLMAGCNLAAATSYSAAESYVQPMPSWSAAIVPSLESGNANLTIAVSNGRQGFPCACGTLSRLYTAVPGAGKLISFAVDAATGAPTPGGTITIGADPQAVAFDPANRFIFAAVAGEDKLAVYSLEPGGGVPVQASGSPYNAGYYPVAVAVHPGGRFVYTANRDANNISAFAVNTVAGVLTPVPGSPFFAASSPRAVVLDPLGRFAYVVNGGSNNISAFTIDPSTGALTPVPGSPFAAGSLPAGAAIDPWGRFLYVANNITNNISAFSIDGASGVLTKLNGSPYAVGLGPTCVRFDPCGRFLYVQNDLARNIRVFKADAVSGALTPQGSPVPTRSSGGRLAIDPLGSYLYLTYPYASQIAVFRLDAVTGLPAESQGSPFGVGEGAAACAVSHPAVPGITISDVTAEPGTAAMEFVVGLSSAGTEPIAVNYATGDATAGSGEDYVPAAGRLVFPPGTTTQRIAITLVNDSANTSDETFLLNLSDATRSLILDGQGVGTIINRRPNNPPVMEAIGDKAVRAGQTLTFTVKATDPDGDSLSFAVSNLPAGATFNQASGVFTWLPATTQIGEFPGVHFEASDGKAAATRDITIAVLAAGTIQVRLTDSAGAGLPGGQVSYAGSSWQSAGVTGADGKLTFNIPQNAANITVRMMYAGKSLDLAQDVRTKPIFVFRTVRALVSLKDSVGSAIAGGTVTYAGSSWQSIGTTDANGETARELLPGSYNFRMTYAGFSKDLTQDVGADSNVIFRTVRTVVSLKDSTGAGLAGGMVTYAGSSWLSMGVTDANGEAVKELLPGSYNFRMTYAGASKDKTQNVGSDRAVNYRTVRAVVSLKDSTGKGLAGGVVTCAGSSWLSMGTTDDVGEAAKELLPVSYNFRMTFAGLSKDKVQDIGADPNVNYQMVEAVVSLKDSTGAGISGGMVSYAGSSWLSIGPTDDTGQAKKELLPGSYNFRMTYAGLSKDKAQDVGANPHVVFQTVRVVVSLKDSGGNGMAGGVVTYAGSSWLSIGIIDDTGQAVRELLPGSYTFRMTYAGYSKDKVQDVGTNANVVFQTIRAAVTLKDSGGKGLADGTVTYAGSSWQSIGKTEASGTVAKELLPGVYTFRMTYAGASQDISQDVGANPLVVFQTIRVAINLKNASGLGLQGGSVIYAGSSWLNFGTSDENGIIVKELLGAKYTFRATYAGVTKEIARDIRISPTIDFSF